MISLKFAKILHFVGILLVFIGVLFSAFVLASWLEESAAARSLVSSLGYVGVFLVAMILGLNVILPVPAATFTPVFLAADLSLSGIIIALACGTFTADILGYYLGHWSKALVLHHYPHTYTLLERLRERHHHLIVPFVFLYAAFVPFPNEAIILPLAIMGVRLRTLILPLLCGAVVSQVIFAYGIDALAKNALPLIEQIAETTFGLSW